MSNNLFQNSKATLGFAAVTLVGAVMLVGTSDNGGMLPKLAERFGSRPAAQPTQAPVVEAPPAPAKKTVSGWYDTPEQAPVFGNYTPSNAGTEAGPEPLGPPPPSTAPAQASPQSPADRTKGGPMNAPLSPTAVAVN